MFPDTACEISTTRYQTCAVLSFIGEYRYLLYMDACVERSVLCSFVLLCIDTGTVFNSSGIRVVVFNLELYFDSNNARKAIRPRSTSGGVGVMCAGAGCIVFILSADTRYVFVYGTEV